MYRPSAFILFVLASLSLVAQSTLQGSVRFETGAPASEVLIYFGAGADTVRSDGDGSFQIPGDTNMDSIFIVKKGYELAEVIQKERTLKVTIRPATIQRVKGKLLSRSGDAVAGQEVYLTTPSGRLTATTLPDGHFAFKIPYALEVAPEDFTMRAEDFEVVDFEKNTERGEINMSVRVTLQTEKSKVKVETVAGNPLANHLILMDSKAYVTDFQGIFYSPFTDLDRLNKNRIQVDNYQVREITRVAVDQFILALESSAALEDISSKDTVQSLVQDTIKQAPTSRPAKTKPIYTGENLGEEIDSLISYYATQQSKFEEQNQHILEITDSLSYLSDLSESDQRKILEKVLTFDQSLNHLDSLFQDTKVNSLELILMLRAKLEQKDLEIQSIENEKNQIAENFRDNVKTFIGIILGFILLLLFAGWVIRRFSIQKRVIEATKKRLIHAQKIAKIGSMVYNHQKRKNEYSENFFETLKVPKKVLGPMMRDAGMDAYERLVSKKDLVRVRQAWKEGMSKKTPIRVDFQGISEENSPIHLSMNTRFNVNINGTLETISYILQDVTEKKEHEFRLVKAIENAEEASRVKDEFLSSMSHEIRTPLNAIIGITDFMLSDKPKREHLSKLNTLHFSGQHLLSLVNDILDFSKIKSGRLRVEVTNIPLEQLLQHLMLTLSFSVKEKGIQLYYTMGEGVPKFIAGDKLKINQVLINLVGNAIKFTEEGEVKLSAEREEDTIVFKVSDTGIGIAAENLEKIFVGFEQESISTAQKYGGTGLGLSISKELANLLGGTLEAESELGVGSVFSFSIPYIEVNETELTEAEDSTTDVVQSDILKGLHILCVEDNEINQIVIKQYFDKWGVHSRFAGTGSQALDILTNETFDLVFMDIRLPDMDGFEATSQIFETIENFSAPIVALTAEMDDRVELKISETGMIGWLGKPFKAEDLHEAIAIYTSDQYQELSDTEKNLLKKEIENRGQDVEEATEAEDEISIDKLKKFTYTQEALDFFIETFTIRIDEFKIAFENALYNRDIEELDGITHNILPHLKLMGMDKMCELIKSYTEEKLHNHEWIKDVVAQVDDYRKRIKKTLQSIK